MIRISDSQAKSITNAAYIAARCRAWEQASPAEREIATLERKDRMTDVERRRYGELLRGGR